jgi:hypothetical protein
MIPRFLSDRASFNARRRDELLDGEIFYTLREANRRFKLIARKGILEQLSSRAVDGDVDGAAADAREIAGSLLKDGKPGVKDVSAYLQWIRKDMRHWMKTGEILDPQWQ